MVNQKPGMEDVVSDKHILLIDRKGETDIIPVPAVFRIFIVSLFLSSWFVDINFSDIADLLNI